MVFFCMYDDNMFTVCLSLRFKVSVVKVFRLVLFQRFRLQLVSHLWFSSFLQSVYPPLFTSVSLFSAFPNIVSFLQPLIHFIFTSFYLSIHPLVSPSFHHPVIYHCFFPSICHLSIFSIFLAIFLPFFPSIHSILLFIHLSFSSFCHPFIYCYIIATFLPSSIHPIIHFPLFLCPSQCLSCLSFLPSIHLFLLPSIHSSLFCHIHLSIYLNFLHSFHLSQIHLFIFLSFLSSNHPLPLYPSFPSCIHLTVFPASFLSIHLPLFPSIKPFIHLSLLFIQPFFFSPIHSFIFLSFLLSSIHLSLLHHFFPSI